MGMLIVAEQERGEVCVHDILAWVAMYELVLPEIFLTGSRVGADLPRN